MDALPYEVISLSVKRANTEGVERVWQEVMASIHRGIPVLMSSEETGLIVGYDLASKTFLCRPYVAPKEGYFPVDSDVRWAKWPWAFEILVPGSERPPRESLIRQSLQRAVMLANTERFPSDGEAYYASGFAAYEVWIQGLRDEARYEEMDQDALFGVMLANGHCYYSLVDTRASAATYLKSIAAEFEEEGAAYLRAAAALCQEMVAECLTKRCPTEIAPMLWMLKEGERWTQEGRNTQAQILEDALQLERKAIAEIETVVALMGWHPYGCSCPACVLVLRTHGARE